MSHPVLFYGRWSKRHYGYNLYTCCGRLVPEDTYEVRALGGGRMLDGGYAPTEGYAWERGKFHREGDARLTYLDHHTVLSVLDRQVDDRGNNHSTFAATGHLECRAMLTLCRSAFPHVFRRLALHPIRVREVRAA